METITLKINGKDIQAPAGSTILEAAKLNEIDIPTLCYLKDINKIGACRMCLVEVKGAAVPMTACNTAVAEGMEIQTESPLVVSSRTRNLELICKNHHLDCEYCPNYSICELHELFVRYGVDTGRFGDFARKPEYDKTSVNLIHDGSRCILCRRCTSTCANQKVQAIAILGRGIKARAGAPEGIGNSTCVGCGQCVTACPTGALFVKEDTHEFWKVLNQEKRPAVAIVEPNVAAALGEVFFEPMGTDVSGKMVAFLHKVGVKKVYNLKEADSSAEKCKEILNRKAEGKKLPALDADCPAFVKYIETFYPELKDNLLTAAAPEITFAVEARKQYAEETGIAPENIMLVYISSCLAQKQKLIRPEKQGIIDAAITTAELAEMFRHACLSRYTLLEVWRHLPEEEYERLPPSPDNHKPVLPGGKAGDTGGQVSESEVVRNGVTISTAAISGMKNTTELLDAVISGKSEYDYLEVRFCPGGCVNGGGQPRQRASVRNFNDTAGMRAKALQPIRKKE